MGTLLLYLTKEKSGACKTWIECDSCKGTMHVSCIPQSHRAKVDYDEKDASGEVDYLCECCYVGDSKFLIN